MAWRNAPALMLADWGGLPSDGALIEVSDANTAAFLMEPSLELAGVVQRYSAFSNALTTGVLLTNWKGRCVMNTSGQPVRGPDGSSTFPRYPWGDGLSEVVLVFDHRYPPPRGTEYGGPDRFFGIANSDGWVRIADVPR